MVDRRKPRGPASPQPHDGPAAQAERHLTALGVLLAELRALPSHAVPEKLLEAMQSSLSEAIRSLRR